MLLLINQLWKLCLFRSGPADLPASSFLLALLFAMNAVITIGFNLTFNQASVFTTITAVIVALASNALLIWGLLHLLNLANRFTQTFSAILGVDIIITFITSFFAMFVYKDGQPDPTSPATLFIFGLFIWTLAVYAFIFHKALNIHMFLATFIAFFMLLFSVAVSQVAVGT